MRFNKCFLPPLSVTLLATALLTVSGCSTKNTSSTSEMHIRFPSTAQSVSQSLSQSAKSSTANSSSVLSSMAGFNWSLVCYMVNVSGSDIPSATSSKCDVPLGVFKGSVPPGGELSLTVPTGTGRTVDVLVYLRSATTDACPTLAADFSTLSRTRIVRVGQTTSVDTTQASVNVEVAVSTPADGVTLISQYSLPNSCRPQVIPQGSLTSRLTAGHSEISGGNYKISGAITGPQSEKILTGGGLTVHLSRRPN